jgi:hypothetical protein
MSKSHDTRKASKKPAMKTPKEKREAKKNRKEAARHPSPLVI